MATSTSQTEEQVVSLKLLVNKEKNKVIFCEAGKDLVDVLFSFLTFPLGTIARLVDKESNMPPVRVGCLNSLYQSVANLDAELLWTEACKEMLLQPRNSAEDYCKNLKLNIDDTKPTEYFVCQQWTWRDCQSVFYSIYKGKRCFCGGTVSKPVQLSSERIDDVPKGFVNGNAMTYIITDDLIVIPNSTEASLGLLKNSGIENTSSVQEITVNVTPKKVLDLLKCSLLSKITLTAWFLEKDSPYLSLEGSKFSLYEAAAPASAAEDSIQINVKLFLRRSNGKIVFAQGEEDFADFVFSFLTLPLGSVLRMFKGSSSVGCMDGLYKSIVDLDGNKYLIVKELKNLLVDPRLPPELKLSKQMLPIYESPAPKYYFYENFFYTDYLDGHKSKPNEYGGFLSKYEIGLDYGPTDGLLYLDDSKSPTGSPDGFAKGPSMYMVTDDLVVAPLSPFSLLNTLKTPLDDLKEMDVSIGIKEGLSILKASLTSYSATNKWSQSLIDRN